MVVAYASDLRSLLGEGDIADGKAFETFVKRVVVEAAQARVYYNLPVPVSGNETKTTEVLPIVTPSGPEGIRTPSPVADPLG